MPLPKYKDGYRADQIVSITPVEILGIPGTCANLKFACGSQSTLIPAWVEHNKPEVGGYFVVKDDKASYVPADKFGLVRET